ncbi:hypothetical protein BGW80DRAFT_1348907 [Lactifluus volemus]|nr:hypothetical protein BGW80DRAFT_1348907 [Lactifluus volemus]
MNPHATKSMLLAREEFNKGTRAAKSKLVGLYRTACITSVDDVVRNYDMLVLANTSCPSSWLATYAHEQ